MIRESPIQSSLRDVKHCVFSHPPSSELLGYYQTSLRDETRRRFAMLRTRHVSKDTVA